MFHKSSSSAPSHRRSSPGGASRPTGGGPRRSFGRPQGAASHGRPSHGRPSHGGLSRGPSRGRGFSHGPSRGSRFKDRSYFDLSKFVNKVSVTEETEIFLPEHAFADFQVDERLKRSIITKGYTTPTPIQDKVIPYILKGEDVVGIANTGTGKTAAFLIPLINKVLLNKDEHILIVVPTRELAIQIQEELRGFTRGLSIFSVCCVGGAAIGPQMKALRMQNNFVIGTPGRLKDLIERGFIPLNRFRTVVLDEADRMLDMGFINDIKYMLALMPTERHTLFFSATLSDEINALISKFLNNPIKISVKTRDTSKSIDQDVVRVRPEENKIEVLEKLLRGEDFSKVLIFGKTKHGVERLAQELVKRGFGAESIHGDKNHSRRQRALGQFKTNKSQILVATDVAARGLDIPDVSHVINFDLPGTYEDYVHRIGRTGRGGKKGKALTFVQ